MQLLQEQHAVAQQMEGGALAEVLHAAVASFADATIYDLHLFELLPNVRQLGVTNVLELLRAAV
jgi:hypothetical protein